MRFAVAIILYNPSLEIIKQTKQYCESFDLVFVFDNSEPNYIKNYSFDNLEKIVYITKNKNIGLSSAFNIILDNERLINFDYLCTLDQDSIFSKEDILRIQNFIRDNSNNFKENTGIIGPFIDYGRKEFRPNRVFDEVEWLITSGSFLNLYLFKKNNIRFDENYFIDKVDADICKQIKLLGLSIKMFYGATLIQSLGESSGYNHPNHSPLRHYYLFRNRFYFNKKYYSFIKRWFFNILQTLRHVILIGIYENKTHYKMSMLFQAYRDYRKGNMSKKNV